VSESEELIVCAQAGETVAEALERLAPNGTVVNL